MPVVFTNGCFDILHRGHIELFKYCKSLGDVLIVGIDCDKRVKKLKGDQRPINNELDRKFMLECIKYVNNVFIFKNELELQNLIKVVNPDIMVVGSDYKGKKVIGSEFARNLKFFERINEYSTTKTIRNITNR
jgi:rfaE bifunctional protein nucleotidyltransferase chain/domain